MPKFEWDERKNLANKNKHGFSFESGKSVFNDNNRVEIEDKRADYGERRWLTIGKVLNVIRTVVYTLRDTTIRIISARRASKKERAKYNENQPS